MQKKEVKMVTFGLGYPSPRRKKIAQRVLLFEKILEVGDATCDELERYTGMLHQSISARINELVKMKRIVWTGFYRLTRTRRPARVYIVNVNY